MCSPATSTTPLIRSELTSEEGEQTDQSSVSATLSDKALKILRSSDLSMRTASRTIDTVNSDELADIEKIRKILEGSSFSLSSFQTYAMLELVLKVSNNNKVSKNNDDSDDDFLDLNDFDHSLPKTPRETILEIANGIKNPDDVIEISRSLKALMGYKDLNFRELIFDNDLLKLLDDEIKKMEKKLEELVSMCYLEETVKNDHSINVIKLFELFLEINNLKIKLGASGFLDRERGEYIAKTLKGKKR